MTIDLDDPDSDRDLADAIDELLATVASDNDTVTTA